jgi:hypothetical protein
VLEPDAFAHRQARVPDEAFVPPRPGTPKVGRAGSGHVDAGVHALAAQAGRSGERAGFIGHTLILVEDGSDARPARFVRFRRVHRTVRVRAVVPAVGHVIDLQGDVINAVAVGQLRA